MHEVKTTCCYCGVGCGIIAETDGRIVLGVKGDPDHPANYGKLCSKGGALHLTMREEARLLHPEMRRTRSEGRQQATWDESLDFVAGRFADIIRTHGPDAVAFYISGQLLTEDYYVFNKLARGLAGTNNIDSNSRLCMSSAVSGYKATLGSDSQPCSYEDIDHANCIFIAGANPAWAHPVLFRRLEAARANNPDLKVIVVDPRKTETARTADLHLPILPGTDVALFNAMLHVMLAEGWHDMAYIDAHTQGFDELNKLVEDYSPANAAAICGIAAESIIQAARWFALSGATLSFYCQGLNQSIHGTDKNAALINLHLATGQIGKPGTGPFSLTGQSNAMGGREVGGMATLLPGHRDPDNPKHRAEVDLFWGIGPMPSKPGKTAVEIFEAMEHGEIKAVWIACTNPAHSLPDQNLVRRALARAELVVLQETFQHTDTAAFADVLLPAASWGEKDGTLTNSERRISRARAVVPPVGEARPDWQITADFARRLAQKLGRAELARTFSFGSAEEVYEEYRLLTRGRDLDISGLSYPVLDALGPQQWPFPAGAESGTVRLFTDGKFATPNGQARFYPASYQPTAEAVSERYPLHFNTGRLRDQWHGMSRTGLVPHLFGHAEEPLLAMHREDMLCRGISDGDVVRVASLRGELLVKAKASDDMKHGQAFLPMHWGSRFMHGTGANMLTQGAIDATSYQPEFKHTAIQVERMPYPWRMLLVRRGLNAERAERIRGLISSFPYASLSLAGGNGSTLVLRAAAPQAVDESLLLEVMQSALLDDDASAIVFRDAGRGVYRRVLVEYGLLTGALICGEQNCCDWIKDQIAQGAAADSVGTWLLSPLGMPQVAARGKIVCACMNVSENEIASEVKHGANMAALQTRLKCGTQCGSCVPEIKRMIVSAEPEQVPVKG